MELTIENYYNKIPNKETITTRELLIYLAYYLENNLQPVSAANLKNCCLNLKIRPYSNIPAWLSDNSKGKNAILIKEKPGCYKLERKMYVKINEFITGEKNEVPSGELLPRNLIENAPFYIEKNINEMLLCYDNGLYSACLVMVRKLIETLIIECFEKYGIENEIKDANGDFLYLSKLIPCFLNASKWNASRNISKSMDKIKKYGDLSAHNRRFFAKKTDLLDLKTDLRQAIQELGLIIGY